uniref:Coat protein n=1 Tax=Steinernema glaseri TaxID=37863 RepID=A0A1I7Z1W8_9BILA
GLEVSQDSEVCPGPLKSSCIIDAICGLRFVEFTAAEEEQFANSLSPSSLFTPKSRFVTAGHGQVSARAGNVHLKSRRDMRRAVISSERLFGLAI